MIQKRLGYIDALRGLLIVLVLVYHLNSGGGERLIVIDFCWPFMMPGFFFISGFVSCRLQETWNFRTLIERIGNKLRCLVVPAVVFYMLFALSQGEDPFAFVRSFGGYWFTPELFKVFCIYYICSFAFSRRPRMLDVILIAVSVIGVCASVLRSGWLAGSSIGFLAAHISNGRMFGYFMLGHFASKYREAAHRIIASDWANMLAVLLFVGSWVLLTCSQIERTVPAVGLGLRWLVAPCAGLFMVYALFFRYRGFFEMEEPVSRICRLVGRRSLDIYMLHYFFLYLYRIGGVPFVETILFDCSNITMQFIGSVVIALMIVCMSLLCSEFIRNSRLLSYWLLGESRKRT